MDKNLSKPVKILILEQIALTAMFYLGQVFVYWRLINKNLIRLERSTTLFSRNHLTLRFWLRREDWQMPITEQLLHQTYFINYFNKNSHWKCSIKKAVLKIFTIFTESVGVSLIRLPAFRPATLLERGTPTQMFAYCEIFKKIYFEECFWTDFRKWLFGTLVLVSRFQNHLDSVILQKYQALSN